MGGGEWEDRGNEKGKRTGVRVVGRVGRLRGMTRDWVLVGGLFVEAGEIDLLVFGEAEPGAERG